MNSRQVSDPARTRAIADPFSRVLLGYASPLPGERALDLACGTGSVARQLSPLVGSTGRVVALDINPQMLAVARSLSPPEGALIEWLEGDAIALPLPTAAFDIVLCQQGLQFFSDRAAAAREMRRVVDDAGRVVASVWQPLDRHPLYEVLFEATTRRLGPAISEVALSFTLGNPDELAALLADAGFRHVEVAARSLDIRLPSPERFVELTVRGAATSVPAFSRLGEQARTALVEAIIDEMRPTIENFRNGNELCFSMSTHIAVGWA
ncbi:MAG TPA: class I SAM-dependent methyltransferase [Burkholderiaceae bacterium]|nr:class I SAM-dependent methyltransferase [Burkholderiaceae bacterium]